MWILLGLLTKTCIRIKFGTIFMAKFFFEIQEYAYFQYSVATGGMHFTELDFLA